MDKLAQMAERAVGRWFFRLEEREGRQGMAISWRRRARLNDIPCSTILAPILCTDLSIANAIDYF